jgi:hypothetical protein
LLAFTVMGRASDVTTHCPCIEDIHFPTGDRDHAADGKPNVLTLTWRDWKGRTPCNVGKPYPLQLHANLRDARFCPVAALTAYLWRVKRTTGPIFVHSAARPGKRMQATQFCRMARRIFQRAGKTERGRHGRLLTCTAHSIRKSGAHVRARGRASSGQALRECRAALFLTGCPSRIPRLVRCACAAQHAHTCDASIVQIQFTGRWKTTEMVSHYLGAAPVDERAAEDRNGSVPDERKERARSFMPWKPVCAYTHGQNEL